MTDLQAAVGLVQLQRLDGDASKAARTGGALLIRLCVTIPGLYSRKNRLECRHNFQSYMVRLQSDAPVTRDELHAGVVRPWSFVTAGHHGNSPGSVLTVAMRGRLRLPITE